MALVHDKFGHFEGLLTLADILDAIAGAFASDEDQAEPEVANVMMDHGCRLYADCCTILRGHDDGGRDIDPFDGRLDVGILQPSIDPAV